MEKIVSEAHPGNRYGRLSCTLGSAMIQLLLRMTPLHQSSVMRRPLERSFGLCDPQKSSTMTQMTVADGYFLAMYIQVGYLLMYCRSSIRTTSKSGWIPPCVHDYSTLLSWSYLIRFRGRRSSMHVRFLFFQ